MNFSGKNKEDFEANRIWMPAVKWNQIKVGISDPEI